MHGLATIKKLNNHVAVYEARYLFKNHFKLSGAGRVYLDALGRCESEYGEKGVKVQILYILSNARAVGDEGKQAKKRLLAYANAK